MGPRGSNTDTYPWFRVAVADVARHVDPLGGEIWPEGPIMAESVAMASPDEMPYNTLFRAAADGGRVCSSTNAYHASRIAFFVRSGVPQDDPYPISLAVEQGKFIVYEGRHRLAAAFLRGDAFICAKVVGKQEDLDRILPNRQKGRGTESTDSPTQSGRSRRGRLWRGCGLRGPG